MIIRADEAVIDCAGPMVAQVMIVHERRPNGRIKRSTALMRLVEADFTQVARPVPLRAMPTYWCPLADGRIALWPKADRDYEIEAMGRDGKPIGGVRKPVPVQPIEAYVAAFTKAQETQAATDRQPQRVERFTLISGDDE